MKKNKEDNMMSVRDAWVVSMMFFIGGILFAIMFMTIGV